MTKLTLKVTATKHPKAAANDDPTILSSDKRKFPTLQDVYKLEQCVTDKYWLQTRDSETSDQWDNEEEESTNWERDEFGGGDDKGEWNSDQNSTTFWDEPGFLGKSRRHARALDKLQRLGNYEISFKWIAYHGSEPLIETDVITLCADPDDDGVITYTEDIEKTWDISV